LRLGLEEASEVHPQCEEPWLIVRESLPQPLLLLGRTGLPVDKRARATRLRTAWMR
jgi:hypothetical protein